MTLCDFCEKREATHLYNDKKICKEHYNVFTEADTLEFSFASAVLPSIKAWVVEMTKEGHDAGTLEAAIVGYVSGQDSPFTLEAIQQLIDEVVNA